MTLEQQVCSLDLAKRLKELGVKQESLFLWCNFGKDDWRGPYSNIDGISIRLPETPGPYSFTKDDCWEWCSAFTVAELLEKMPDYIDADHGRSRLKIDKDSMYPGIEYSCGYHSDALKGFNAGFVEDDSLSNALAKMLVYLLENKLITL